MKKPSKCLSIKVCARNSNLSKRQVNEILEELKPYEPEIQFDVKFLKSKGDEDQTTSLRKLDKTNFFTKELDDLVLSGQCDIGIHSAKDLPDPLPHGLKVIAVTKGVNSSDSLVLKNRTTLDSLPKGAKIATSSKKREEAVKKLRDDLTFTDIRGTIEKRLEQMNEGYCDGVVIAEAALIRLDLTHLNRITLPGHTTPLQGQLAIIAREDISAFSFIDARKKVLHLGLRPKKSTTFEKITHVPIIQVVPRSKDHDAIINFFKQINKATHIIFTSQTAVTLFFQYLSHFNIDRENLDSLTFVAVGKKTKKMIERFGFLVSVTPDNETAEGVIEEIQKVDSHSSYFLWPHSAQARTVIKDFFLNHNSTFSEAIFYDTIPNESTKLPDLEEFDEILFTSPSCVDAFLHFYGSLPKNKRIRTQGLITEKYLSNL